jgi:ATP-dependent DNA helicase RecG
MDPRNGLGLEALPGVVGVLRAELTHLRRGECREGDVLGANQSGGRSSLRLLRVIRDAELIQDARVQAERVLLEDPTLEKNPQLAAALADLEESAQDNLSKN